MPYSAACARNLVETLAQDGVRAGYCNADLTVKKGCPVLSYPKKVYMNGDKKAQICLYSEPK